MTEGTNERIQLEVLLAYFARDGEKQLVEMPAEAKTVK